MPNQYHNFNNQNLESHILFYGEQACQPDEYFEGNNLRKTMFSITSCRVKALLLQAATTQSN